MKKYRYTILALLVTLYTFFFIATSKAPMCDSECERFNRFNSILRQGREGYILGGYRCGPNRVSDTICLYVNDITGINWGLLADTACMTASQVGLTQHKIFVIKNSFSSSDTLARKNCP